MAKSDPEGAYAENASGCDCSVIPFKAVAEVEPATPMNTVITAGPEATAPGVGFSDELGKTVRIEALHPARKDKAASRHMLVVGAAAFVTTLAQMEVIGQLPIRYLLKSYLHVTPEQMSLFLLCSGIAWYLKPLAGLISDSIPLFGTRRRHYLMLSAVAAGLCWILLAVVPKTYYPVLLTAIVLNGMMVMASTVMGGLLVEEAQKAGATGRLSSLREGLNTAAVMIGLPAGGYLAERAFGWTATAAASLLFILALIVYLYLREDSTARRKTEIWRTTRTELGTLYRSRTLWAAGALLFLFYVTPGLATPLYYRQIDTLGFSQSFIGWLAVVGGITGMIGAVMYARVCKRYSLGPLLVAGIVLSAVTTLFYLAYDSDRAAVIIVATSGFFGTLGVIPIYDLAARATPYGCEGLGFALMMSVRNLAANGADWIGSWLMQTHGWSFSSLVYINAATTLLVLLAIPLLPHILLIGKDRGESRRPS